LYNFGLPTGINCQDHKSDCGETLEHSPVITLDQKLLEFLIYLPDFYLKDLQQGLIESILVKSKPRQNPTENARLRNFWRRHEKLYSGGSHKASFFIQFKKREGRLL